MTAAPLENLAQRIAQQQSELETLRREYESRQAQLADLARRKEELQSQLQQVEAEMNAITQGSSAKAPPGPTQQAALLHTLPQVLVDIVGAASRPMRVKEIAGELIRRKFPTTSRDIPNLVATRVRELIQKGSLRKATGQMGVVLGESENGHKTASPAVKPRIQVSGKNGAVAHRKAQRTKQTHRPGQPTLREVLSRIMQKSKRPLTGSELAKQVQATGYQSSSKNFVTSSGLP